MEIRQYNPMLDFGYIYSALVSEGLRFKETTFKTDEVVITDVGFFTYTKPGYLRYPCVHHFYVNPEQRTFKNFLGLLKDVRYKMFSMGSVVFIAQEPKNKPYIGRMIKFSGGIEAGKKNGHTYHLVPVLKKGSRKRKKHANL